MKLPTRMTSSTGNKRQGFTFVEMMIALVILSSGIVMIYKSFFLCLDHLSYLSCRFYASQMLENKISQIQRAYRESQDAAFERGAMTENMKINNKWIDFNYQMEISPLLGMDYVYRLNIVLSWHDGRRLMRLSKQALLSKI